jgi:hypothetical protein
MERVLLFALIISAYWYVMGLAAVQLAYIRAMRGEGVLPRLEAVEDASHYQGVLLVPGAIAVGFAGAFYWTEAGYNLITTEWMWPLELSFAITLLVCLPLIGAGLRRTRIAALKAKRDPALEPELDRALTETVVPLFGGLAVVLMVIMTAVSVFGP